MNKKNLVVGISAGVLAVGAVGASFALYKVAPENKEITIGVHTSTDVNYKIGTVSDDAVLLSPSANVRTYTFDISGTVADTSPSKQPYILAGLGVDIKATKADVWDYVTPKLSVGYKAETHFANTESLNTMAWTGSGDTKNGKLNTYIRTNLAAESQSNTATLTLTLNDGISDADFIANCAEVGFQISISLGEVPEADYQRAHLAGTMNGWATDDPTYEMVANIDATSWEWMWMGNIDSSNEIKAVCGETWSANNVNPSVGMTGAYWNGNGSGNVTFSTN